MKKVLIVVAVASTRPDNMNWLPLRDALRSQMGAAITVDMCSLANLVFDISNKGCSVIDASSGIDIDGYDFVVIRNVGKTSELGIALAHYLAMKHIPFTDSYLETHGAGKLACAMLRRRHDLPTPRTVFAKSNHLAAYISGCNAFSFPFVLKADNGKKGRDNYLIKTIQELDARLAAQPDVAFIAQEFIDNDGDYRALVMDGKIALVIKRMAASSDTHLNNTSQGGSAELKKVDVFSKQIQSEILLAAHVEGLEVAGVDIIFNKTSGSHYFLEVNRAPQIGTGAFADEKIAAYATMINKRLQYAQN